MLPFIQRNKARVFHLENHPSGRFMIAALAMLVAGIVGIFTANRFADAATTNFVQTSWAGGATATIAVSPGNQTGWTQYSSATSTTAAANVTLTSTNYVFTDDGATSTAPVSAIAAGGGFTNGTFSSTTVSGSGTGASVGLGLVAPSTFSSGLSPVGVAFDVTNNAVWIANYDVVNTVTKLNAVSGALIGAYSVGTIAPQGVAFDVTNNAVWTANTLTSSTLNGTVTKLNALTGATIGTYDAANSSVAVAFDVTNNAVWAVGNYLDAFHGAVVKINAVTGAFISSVSLPGLGHNGVAFDVTNNAVWVTNDNGTVTKLDAPTNTLIGTYTVGANPSRVAFDVTNNAVWVTNSGDNTVTKLNAATGALIGTYTVGTSPQGVIFDVTNNAVWVTNSGDNTVTKLNAATGALIGTYTVGTSPQSAAFDVTNNSVWISNNTDGTVTKLNATGAYVSPGTFTSAVIDLGALVNFTTLSYTKVTPVNTTLTVDVRGSVDNVTWSAWTNDVASGGSLAAFSGDRYFQYRANLATTDTTVTPTLNDVTINYSQYQSSGTLTSSVFDSGFTSNIISKLAWAATGTSSTSTLKFQVRSSADGATWSNWCGPSIICDGSDYFLDANNGVALVANHPLTIGGNDRYFEYQAFLAGDGTVTPTLTSVTTSYGPAATVISAVTSSGITTTGATITWTTDTPSDSYVQYSTSPSLTSPTTIGNATLTTSHSVALTGLTAGTQYYYEVQSTDATSQLTTDTNGGSYYTFATTASTPTPTPTPVVSRGSGGAQHPLPSTPSVTTGSSTAITDTGATLNGYVDPNTTTDTTRWFEWGTSASNLSNKTVARAQGSLASFFSGAITGLTSNTRYYFRAVAKNAAGTIAGFNGSFTTTGNEKPRPPVISNVANGISTCRIPFSWNITDATAPNIYNATKGTQYTDAISGDNIHFPIIHGVNIIQIRDGETVLKTLLINCSYAL